MATVFDFSSGASILIAEAASEPERFAAHELSRYLAIITGRQFPVVGHASEPCIMVGKQWPGTPPLPAGGYYIGVEPHRIILSGADAQATLHAIYAFLGDHCGCRWLAVWEGGELVPRRPDLQVPCGARLYRPAFSHRAFTNFPDIDRDTVHMVDWMAKNRFNRFMVNAWAPQVEQRYGQLLRKELTLRGMAVEWSHHSFHFWVPPEKYFSVHPEYFALVDGRRRPDKQLCTSNPAVAQIAADNICSFLQEHPEVDIVGLWPTDGFGWCECDNCLAMEPQQPSELYPDHPRRTDTYLAFVNAVAERVAAVHPDCKISALAYVNYVEPPVQTQLHPNVVVCFAPMHRCFKHPLDAPPECTQANSRYARLLEQWRTITPGTLYLFCYLMLIDTCSLPYRITGMLQPNFKWLADAGIDGYVMEYKPQEWGPFGVNGHLIGQLSWQADMDVEAWLQEYYRALYGPASDLMDEFWKVYLRDFIQPGPCVYHYDLTYTRRATEQLLSPALAILGQARAKAAGEGDKRHLQAVERDVLSMQLLLRFGRWQRAVYQARDGAAHHRRQARSLAEELIAWAQAHGDSGAIFAPRIQTILQRWLEQ